MSEAVPKERIRAMQIIAGALVMGVLVFAGVVVFGLKALDEAPGQAMVSIVAAVQAIVCFGLHLVIPPMIARKAIQANNNMEMQDWCNVYQTQMVTGLALLEGAAFLSLVAVMIEHQAWPLGIAGGLVVWMLARFPTENSVREWIEARQSERF